MDWSLQLHPLTTADLLAEEEHTKVNLAEAAQSEVGPEYPAQLRGRLGCIHQELSRRRHLESASKLRLPKTSPLSPAIISSILGHVDLTALIEETDTVYRAESNTPFFECPAHPDAHPSAYIYKKDHPHERWWCFQCLSGGDAIDWMIARHHLEFGPAVRELARRAGVAIPDPKRAQTSASRLDLPAVWERDGY